METDFPSTTRSDERNILSIPRERTTLRGQADDDAIDQYHPHYHPLHNDLVLIHLFGYLKLKEIKKCRAVCQQWNNLSEPFLLRLSKVKLSKGEIQKYLETFENSSFRPSAFEFPEPLPNKDPPLNLDEFEKFLRKNKDTMEELHYEWQNRRVRQGGLERVRPPWDKFDMSLWIGDNLKVLKGHHHTHNEFVFSTNKLQSLKELSLLHCSLNIVTGAPIKSSKVTFAYLYFLRNGKRVPTDTVFVNQFLDLSQVKELSIPYEVQLNMDTEYPLHLKLLEIFNCNDDDGVLNWAKAKGTIEELRFTNCEDMPIIVNDKQTIIKKIHLFLDPKDDVDRMSMYGRPTIKLSSLPSQIEKLEITIGLDHLANTLPTYLLEQPYFDFENSGSVNLPALKYLEIANSDDMKFLRQLEDCPNLKHAYLFKSDNIKDRKYVCFGDSEDDDYDFSVSSLPKSLKTLALSGYKLGKAFNFINEIELDHLYLQFYEIYDVKVILRMLSAKHVYLDACLKPKPKTYLLDLLSADFMFKTLTVGPFTWTDDNSDDEYDIDSEGDKFHGSKFAKRMGLDEESEYYVFENGKGKAITKDKLKQMLKESETHFPDVPISKRPWLCRL